MNNVATKFTKLEAAALELFQVKTHEAIRACLWALGLRETCSRCLGSGHYSRNSMGSTICYKCGGRKTFAAKLTRAVLEQARTKVAAGELEACRARARAQREAKAMVAPKVAAGEAIYQEISDAFSRTWRAGERAGVYASDISEAACLAQGVNNALYFGEGEWNVFRRAPARGMRTVQRDVEAGRLDGIRACAELDALLDMLTELRDAWRVWEAAQRTRLRSAAHARLAA